jgi:hypothetical protein
MNRFRFDPALMVLAAALALVAGAVHAQPGPRQPRDDLQAFPPAGPG